MKTNFSLLFYLKKQKNYIVLPIESVSKMLGHTNIRTNQLYDMLKYWILKSVLIWHC